MFEQGDVTATVRKRADNGNVILNITIYPNPLFDANIPAGTTYKEMPVSQMNAIRRRMQEDCGATLSGYMNQENSRSDVQFTIGPKNAGAVADWLEKSGISIGYEDNLTRDALKSLNPEMAMTQPAQEYFSELLAEHVNRTVRPKTRR